MKLYSMISGLALVAATIAAPAYASSVSPTGTAFSATGSATLMKTGYPTQFCTLTITGNTGDGVNGTLGGGSNTGSGLCTSISVAPSTFKITGTVDATHVKGEVADLKVILTVAGVPVTMCDQTNAAFTVDTSGNIVFNGPLAPNCSVTTTLVTSPTIVAVP